MKPGDKTDKELKEFAEWCRTRTDEVFDEGRHHYAVDKDFKEYPMTEAQKGERSYWEALATDITGGQ